MATTVIENTGDFSGLVGTSAVEFASTLASVTVISGLTATKTANLTNWVNGELTYTVVVSNAADNEAFTGGVFTDQLDPAITLASSADPVQIDGSPVAYTFTGNLLTINNLPEVAAGASITITFRVVQV